MQTLTVLQLQNMVSAFCSHIITQKQKINSINVFPVPDQDTGSNLAFTFEKVQKVISKRKFKKMHELTQLIQETAIYSAQGNSGIIFTGFLSGFLGSIESAEEVTVKMFCKGFDIGAKKARTSIEHPKKGTILDVIDAVAVYMGTVNYDTISYEELLNTSFLKGTTALSETTNNMAVLKEAKVVDAGALGFIIMIESFYESLTGKKLEIKQENESFNLKKGVATIKENRYEVVFIVEESMMSSDEIKDMLIPLGDSIDIIDVAGKIKVHIHTDQQNTVKEIAESLGEISYLQLADMKEEKILELVDKSKK